MAKWMIAGGVVATVFSYLLAIQASSGPEPCLECWLSLPEAFGVFIAGLAAILFGLSRTEQGEVIRYGGIG